MSKKASYMVYKEYINSKGVMLPIMLVNNVSEIMEFNSKAEATEIAQMFESNSDSGWKYKVKKVG